MIVDDLAPGSQAPRTWHCQPIEWWKSMEKIFGEIPQGAIVPCLKHQDWLIAKDKECSRLC